MAYEDLLALRLKNCLATLFEMEDALMGSDIWLLAEKDFAVLREAAERLRGVTLTEEEVGRVEAAVATFLKELEGSLLHMAPEKARRMLQ